MRVLVAVPVFNEARYVLGVLTELGLMGHDVLVVDDGSTDETPQLLKSVPGIVVIRHPENRGYGQSLIDAFQYADRRGYDWIITIDCDDQHEPARIPLFMERARLDDADIISGSRYLAQLPGSTNAPEDRRRINEKVTRMLNRVLGLSLTDGFCGFKAYRVSKIARLPLSIPGYAFPLQFWVQAVHHNLRIRELPVPLIYHDPHRHFGGLLDDPDSRLRHYVAVFRAELAKVRRQASACRTSIECLSHCE